MAESSHGKGHVVSEGCPMTGCLLSVDILHQLRFDRSTLLNRFCPIDKMTFTVQEQLDAMYTVVCCLMP